MTKRYKERMPNKPAPNERAIVFPFNDNKQFDIETRRYPNLGHISLFKRIKGNKMVNEETGEVIDIKEKEKRIGRAVFRILKDGNRLIKNNFSGNKSELLIILEFDKPITDIKKLKKLIKNFIEKLRRKLGDIIFIRILVYYEENKPDIDIWVKKVDNSTIEIRQEDIQLLWKERKCKNKKHNKRKYRQSCKLP